MPDDNHGIHIQSSPNTRSSDPSQLYQHQAVCNCGWRGEVWGNGQLDDHDDAALEGSQHLQGKL